MDSAAVKRTT